MVFGTAELQYRELIRFIRALPLPLAAKFHVRVWLIHIAWSDPWLQDINSGTFTFLDLLGHACFLDCTDPLDRIYAFLGHPLSKVYNGSRFVVPDYQKDRDSVYLEVTTRLLQSEGLRVLSKVNISDSALSESLPSWVVRWDACRINNRIHHSLYSPFRASRGIEQKTKSPIEGQCLTLTGIEVGTIVQSYRILPSADGQCPRFQVTGSLGIENLRGVLETLRALDIPRIYNYSWGNALRLTLSCWPTEDTIFISDSDLRMHLFSSKRTLFVTDKGFYGLGPDFTRPGDICCVLFGADVPMAVRAQETETKLLGESYVRGLMSGQIVNMLKEGLVSEKQFIIT